MTVIYDPLKNRKVLTECNQSTAGLTDYVWSEDINYFDVTDFVLEKGSTEGK